MWVGGGCGVVVAQWEGGKGGAVAAYGRHNGRRIMAAFGVARGAGDWLEHWRGTGRWGAVLWHAREERHAAGCWRQWGRRSDGVLKMQVEAGVAWVLRMSGA